MAKYRIITNTETGKKEYIIDDFLDFDDLLDIIYDIKSKDYKNEQIIINQKVEYKHQNIDRIVNFSHCIFEKDVFFICITFKKKALFINTIFNGITNFNLSIFLGEHCNFVKAKFNKQTHFERTKFHSNNTSFGKTEFNNKTFFSKADFYNEVSIGATFTDNVHFNEAKFLGDRIKFNGSIFNEKVRFHHCKFHHWVEFENTTFNKLVDFYDAKFFAPQQFLKTDFNEVAIFSNATFEKEAQFIYCTTDISSSYISFQSAKFKKGFDIARANFNCKVSCWDIQVEDKGLLEAINSDYYFSDFDIDWLNENRNNKEELDKWTPASKKLRESMRFIKNNFYAENNRIEGSQFEKKELEIYRQEVKSQSNRFKTKVSEINEPTTQWEKWLKYYDTSFVLQINSLFIIGLMLFLYIISTHHLFYGATLLFFIITMGSHLIYKERTIKKSIKQNNYIPYILILASICLYFIALYDIHHIKNNDNSIIVYITFLAIFIAFGFTYLFFNEDKILLFLNKNSNDFGVSWIVGVNFTILVGLITYLPILGYLYQNNCISFDLSINGLGNFFQNFGEVLNPLKWTNLCLFNTEPTGWIYVWIFIGRIFIGYGYYQTIQAFRKYGKS